MGCMGNELTGFVDGLLGCLVRMNADRAPYVFMRLGNSAHTRETVEARADCEHAAHTSVPGAVHHGREFAVEFRVIEMTVTVDEHFATASGFHGGLY
jgi:hypothetical protein